MRIGIFTYGMRDRLTGIGRYTLELSYAVARLDPSVRIILLNPYPDSPLPWYRDFESYPVPALALAPAAAVVGSPVLARAVRRHKLDILHDPCGIGPFLAPRFGAKRIVTIHDAIPYVQPSAQPLMTHLVFRTLLPLARWTADAVTTCSEHAKLDVARYMRIPREKIFVTSSGTTLPSRQDLQHWSACVPDVLANFGSQHPYFLYVGALNPRKNVQRVLAAFRRVHDRRSDVRLIIVGPETWWASETLQSAEAMRDVVHLTGYVDDETLHILYTGAAAVVFPSLYEGFGLPPLEAMAHGTPAITSTVSSLPEVAGDAALLVDPYDVEAIAGAMERILTEPGLAAELSERGRVRASHFSWDNVGRKALDVYRSVLA